MPLPTTTPATVKVHIKTLGDESFGSSGDYAVVALTPYLKARIQILMKALETSQADRIESANDGAECFFEDPDTCFDAPCLVVDKSREFYWTGFVEGTNVPLETEPISFDLLKAEPGSVHDLRDALVDQIEPNQTKDEGMETVTSRPMAVQTNGTRIVVMVSGGLVNEVIADAPLPDGLELFVRDEDEDAEEKVLVSKWVPEVLPRAELDELLIEDRIEHEDGHED